MIKKTIRNQEMDNVLVLLKLLKTKQQTRKKKYGCDNQYEYNIKLL